MTAVDHRLTLESRYALSAGVKYRYEDFGGIIYKRQNDQLLFIRSRLAIDLLDMAGQGTVRDIISIIGKAASQDTGKSVLNILSSLKEMGIIYELAR